jgi:hypothetical protein
VRPQPLSRDSASGRRNSQPIPVSLRALGHLGWRQDDTFECSWLWPHLIVQADAVIFATGFDTFDFCSSIDVKGVSGRTLAAAWAGEPRAYYGMMVPDFPNVSIDASILDRPSSSLCDSLLPAIVAVFYLRSQHEPRPQLHPVTPLFPHWFWTILVGLHPPPLTGS